MAIEKTYRKLSKKTGKEQEYEETIKETVERVTVGIKISDIDAKILELQQLRQQILSSN